MTTTQRPQTIAEMMNEMIDGPNWEEIQRDREADPEVIGEEV